MRPKRGRPGKATFLWSLEGRVLSPRKAARRASPLAKAGEGESSHQPYQAQQPYQAYQPYQAHQAHQPHQNLPIFKKVFQKVQ